MAQNQDKQKEKVINLQSRHQYCIDSSLIQQSFSNENQSQSLINKKSIQKIKVEEDKEQNYQEEQNLTPSSNHIKNVMIKSETSKIVPEQNPLMKSHMFLLIHLKHHQMNCQQNYTNKKYPQSRIQGYTRFIDLSESLNLKEFMKKVFLDQSTVRIDHFSPSLKDLKFLLDKCLQQLLTNQDHIFYQQISSRNKDYIMKDLKKRNIKQCNFDSRVMYRVDILSIFLKAEAWYNKFYQKKRYTIVTLKSLQYLLQLEEKIVNYCYLKYSQIDQNLIAHYPFSQKLQEIIRIAGILQLKYKISNFNQRGRQKIYVQDVKNMGLDFKMIYKQSKTQLDVMQPKYRFSQIVFSFEHQFKFSPQRLSKIHTILSQIPFKTTQQQRKDIYYRTHTQNRVTISFLHDSHKKIYLDNYQRRINYFFNQVQAYQWSNLKVKNISTLLMDQEKVPLSTVQQFIQEKCCDILVEVFKTAIRRLLDTFKACKAMITLEQKLFDKKNIYIKRFQYVSNQPLSEQLCKIEEPYKLEQWQNNLKKQQLVQNDIINPELRTSTVILAIKGEKIIYSCTFKRKINNRQYVNFIKNQMKEVFKNQENFNIILTNFKPDQHFDTLLLRQLINFYKKNYNSNVYLALESQKDQLFLTIDVFLRRLMDSQYWVQAIMQFLMYFFADNYQLINAKQAEQNTKQLFMNNIVRSLNQNKNILCLAQMSQTTDIIGQMKRSEITLGKLEQMMKISTRLLLIYQVYFKQMIYKLENGENLQSFRLVEKQFRQLSQLFESQNQQISSLFPYDYPWFVQSLLSISLFKVSKLPDRQSRLKGQLKNLQPIYQSDDDEVNKGQKGLSQKIKEKDNFKINQQRVSELMNVFETVKLNVQSRQGFHKDVKKTNKLGQFIYEIY